MNMIEHPAARRASATLANAGLANAGLANAGLANAGLAGGWPAPGQPRQGPDPADRMRSPATTWLDVNNNRCEALFASALQRSDGPTPDMVAQAIMHTMRQFGTRGCACRMAQEFGDHPEAAAERMRWVRQLVAQTPAPPSARPGQRPGVLSFAGTGALSG